MGTKRNYTQFASSPQPGPSMPPTSNIHPSRQAFHTTTRPNKSKKPKTTPFTAPTPTTSTATLKKRIRSLTRLLARSSTSDPASDKLPADVRRDTERALAAYKQELQELEEERDRSRLIGKYHMVRFIAERRAERQKATRRLKKLRKVLSTALATTSTDGSSSSSTDPKITALQTAIHIASVDLNYTLYHPLDQKYTSLYAPKASQAQQSASDVEAEAETEAEDSQDVALLLSTRAALPYWKEVESRMKSGGLEDLRNGKSKPSPAPDADLGVKTTTKRASKKAKTHEHARPTHNVRADSTTPALLNKPEEDSSTPPPAQSQSQPQPQSQSQTAPQPLANRKAKRAAAKRQEFESARAKDLAAFRSFNGKKNKDGGKATGSDDNDNDNDDHESDGGFFEK
ncbi:MAG: hypothetical protein M1819_006113 [Sarea resinae]|nr:MAG: hypothetical protein M1819_006113 [Sarea resinae]